MALERVATRVSKGGHNIPEDVIERRYYSGIRNLLNLYIPVCDNWRIFDNRKVVSELIAKGASRLGETMINPDIWDAMLIQQMMVKNKELDLDELSAKILAGINKALRKLTEAAAANNQRLVVGDDKGGFKSVPAKELLETLPK
jgi:hypothetical protein